MKSSTPFYEVSVTTPLRKDLHWVKGDFQVESFLKEQYPYGTHSNYSIDVKDISIQEYKDATGHF